MNLVVHETLTLAIDENTAITRKPSGISLNKHFACRFSGDNCYHCMIINGRHENVIQYRESTFIESELDIKL